MFGKGSTRLVIVLCGLTMTIFLAMMSASPSFAAETIVDEWNTVKVPSAPELKPVTVDLKSTVLLVADIVKQICSPVPRCVASLPRIQALLAQARAKGVPVIYSLGGAASAADILPEVAPRAGEPMVSSGPDKFLGTDLEKILKDKGAQTVIIVGVNANGAVLHTGSEAAFRGFKVVVPVDGTSAGNLYAEQYTAWHLANAPRVSTLATLTRTDLIQFP
jgi:nicotinamidase-related amidase